MDCGYAMSAVFTGMCVRVHTFLWRFLFTTFRFSHPNAAVDIIKLLPILVVYAITEMFRARLAGDVGYTIE